MLYVRFRRNDLGHISEHHPQLLRRVHVQNRHLCAVRFSGSLGDEHRKHIHPRQQAVLNLYPVIAVSSPGADSLSVYSLLICAMVAFIVAMVAFAVAFTVVWVDL